MGNKQTIIKDTSVLLVLQRRKLINDTLLEEIEDESFKKFYTDNRNAIEKGACDLYGKELLAEIKKSPPNINNINSLVEEINTNRCRAYRSKEIYEAVDNMSINYNTQYIKPFEKLSGYLTVDAVIRAILSGNRDLYQRLKEPVSRASGEYSMLDRFKRPIEKSKIMTLTDMSNKELAAFAIYSAVVSFATSNSEDRKSMIEDIVYYVSAQLGLISEEESIDIFFHIVDLLSDGSLREWSPKLLSDMKDRFKIPTIEPEVQVKTYKALADLIKHFEQR